MLRLALMTSSPCDRIGPDTPLVVNTSSASLTKYPLVELQIVMEECRRPVDLDIRMNSPLAMSFLTLQHLTHA